MEGGRRGRGVKRIRERRTRRREGETERSGRENVRIWRDLSLWECGGGRKRSAASQLHALEGLKFNIQNL